MIKRLIIGSTNPGKVNEWKKLLGKNFDIVSISEVGDFPEPMEVGKTFAENAELKAKHYALLIKNYVLADDGGFEIDALGGAPGIKSRRILPGDKDGTDQELIDYVLSKMKSVPKRERTARLIAYTVVVDGGGNVIFEDSGEKRGYITRALKSPIIPGYPYRSILYLPEVRKTYAELTEDEYERLSHRRPVAERLAKFLLKYNHARY